VVKWNANIPHALGVHRFWVVPGISLTESVIYRRAIFLQQVVLGDFILLEMSGAGERSQIASVGPGEAQAPNGSLGVEHVLKMKGSCCWA
jgi:hypothetical protein